MNMSPCRSIPIGLLSLHLLGLPVRAAEATLEMSKVTPSLYLLKARESAGHLVGNVAFLVTSHGVLVVDSGSDPAHGRLIHEKIREVTDQPIRYLVLTHHHPDHTGGARTFADEAKIVCHTGLLPLYQQYVVQGIQEAVQRYPEALEELEKKVEQLKAENSLEWSKEEQRLRRNQDAFEAMKAFRPFDPDITFEKKLTIRLGDETVEVSFPGATSTGDNCLVRFTRQRVLHTGDMLITRFIPLIDRSTGADTANWIAELRRIQEYDIDKVIPGHGEVTDKAGPRQLIAYLTELRAQVEGANQKGMALEEMQRSIRLPAWESLDWWGLLPGNVEAVYREINEQRSAARKP